MTEKEFLSILHPAQVEAFKRYKRENFTELTVVDKINHYVLEKTYDADKLNEHREHRKHRLVCKLGHAIESHKLFSFRFEDDADINTLELKIVVEDPKK